MYEHCSPPSPPAAKYNPEKAAKEEKEHKEKQLKRIEEAKKKAAESKGQSVHSSKITFWNGLVCLLLQWCVESGGMELLTRINGCVSRLLPGYIVALSLSLSLCAEDKKEAEKSSGFVEKLITQIVRNVQVQ